MNSLNSSYLNAIAQLAIVKKWRPRRRFIKHKPRLRMNINRKIRHIRVLQTPTSKHHKTFEVLTFFKLSRENSKKDLKKTSKKLPHRKSRGRFRRTRKRKEIFGLPSYTPTRENRCTGGWNEIEETSELDCRRRRARTQRATETSITSFHPNQNT